MDYFGVDEMFRENAPPRVDTIPGYVSNNGRGKKTCLVLAWSVTCVDGQDLRRNVSNFAHHVSKRNSAPQLLVTFLIYKQTPNLPSGGEHVSQYFTPFQQYLHGTCSDPFQP